MAPLVLAQIYQKTGPGSALPGVRHAHVAPGGPQDPRRNHRRRRVGLVPPEQEVCGVCHFFQWWSGNKDEEVLLLHTASCRGMWMQRIPLCVQTCSVCACPKDLTEIRAAFTWCQWALEHPTVGSENFTSIVSKPFRVRTSFPVVYCLVCLFVGLFCKEWLCFIFLSLLICYWTTRNPAALCLQIVPAQSFWRILEMANCLHK